jgi:hypothetical protein
MIESLIELLRFVKCNLKICFFAVQLGMSNKNQTFLIQIVMNTTQTFSILFIQISTRPHHNFNHNFTSQNMESIIQPRCTRNQKIASVVLFGVPQYTTSSPSIVKSFFEQSLFDKNVLSIVFQFAPVIERCTTCNNPKCLYMVYNTEFNPQKWIFAVNQVFVVKDTHKNKCYAVITNVTLAEVYIHYIGWQKHWDEWISKTSPRIDAIYPSETQLNSIRNHQLVYPNMKDDIEKMSIVKEAHKLFVANDSDVCLFDSMV